MAGAPRAGSDYVRLAASSPRFAKPIGARRRSRLSQAVRHMPTTQGAFIAAVALLGVCGCRGGRAAELRSGASRAGTHRLLSRPESVLPRAIESGRRQSARAIRRRMVSGNYRNRPTETSEACGPDTCSPDTYDPQCHPASRRPVTGMPRLHQERYRRRFAWIMQETNCRSQRQHLFRRPQSLIPAALSVQLPMQFAALSSHRQFCASAGELSSIPAPRSAIARTFRVMGRTS